ncbi:hypothetical protein [Janthinobacterium psychrotolerans]|uniref:Uncharacterized protein n=1 Tax=Janthinobacterium psychrotolerans TaxID=1747903 RepID=A0A1A7BY87_9BURK|nr:hypothetical protein [Janthinobacterium psychrotolerans]OBV37704.1 hypothetical protein ASR47_1003368 [Janthinobacterium psychrotolerans]
MAPHTAPEALTDSTHVSIPFMTCIVCRRALEANATPQQPEDKDALKKIATDLYHELLAARAVISEMTNNMTAPQKRVASTNLYEAGFMGASGGMTRAAEHHKVLRAAEALGIK